MKMKVPSNNSSAVSNGGILGSGIFGAFGTFINCDAKDDSIYCNIMKLFNLMIVFIIVCFILYYIYIFLFASQKKFSSRSK
jgi:hypothetical protein